MIHEIWLRVIGLACVFMLGMLLELCFQADQTVKRRGVIFNCVYTVIFEVIDVSIALSVGTSAAVLLNRLSFVGLIPIPWNDRGSIWLALPLAFVGVILSDFFYYWFHRLQHTSPWLWAQHELHHSDECMNVTTALRHHWLERPLYALFITAPMTILFKPPIVTVAAALLVAQLPGYFVHLNSRIRFGPLNRIFACPQTHRIHHSKLPQHIDKNFAVCFAMWDVIFGTYFHPAKNEWPPTGLASGRTVYSIAEALSMPFFTWAKMIMGLSRKRLSLRRKFLKTS